MSTEVVAVRDRGSSFANVRGSARRAVLGAAGFGLWLALWQWATSFGPLANTFGIPTLSETAGMALELAVSPAFWESIGITLLTTLIAILLSILLGLILGVAMGMYNWVNALLEPMSQFLRAIPPVVVLPLFLLILGPTVQLAVALAVAGGFWPILVQAHVGVRDVDPVAVDTARSMSLRWRMTQTAVILPSALPYFASGVRIAASLSLMLTIGAGILGGAPGLGRTILVAQQTGDSASVFAILIWAGLLGVVVNQILAFAEVQLLRHRFAGETS